jgi:hypothetical protein
MVQAILPPKYIFPFSPFFAGFHSMWIQFTFQTKLHYVPSGLIRKLKNGSSVLGLVSNRDFFKEYVNGGYWRYDLIDDKVRFQMFVDLIDLNQLNQLRIRVRKLGVRLVGTLMLKETEVNPLKYPYLYRGFGIYYKKNFRY